VIDKRTSDWRAPQTHDTTKGLHSTNLKLSRVLSHCCTLQQPQVPGLRTMLSDKVHLEALL
jgi:hypothetical protein